MSNRTFTTLVTAVAVVIATSCGSDGGDESAAPVSDGAPPASEVIAPSTEAAVPVASAVPATAASEPLPLTGNLMLDGGSTYRTETLDPEVTFTVPADQGEEAWISLFATPLGFVILARPDEKTPGVPADSEPGMQLAPVAPGVTADEVVAAVEAYASENETLDVRAETGMIAGVEVPVLRGTSFDRGDDIVEIPTSDESRFLLPTGPREFLAYLLEGPSGTVVVVLDGHELEFDFLVTRATPLLDSIEFS